MENEGLDEVFSVKEEQIILGHISSLYGQC